MSVEAQAAPGSPESPLLLLTKLHAPAVPEEAVARPRLSERLDAGRGRRLTLVACPAGFGKSTLLAAWHQAQEGDRPVAWLTIDERDDDAVVLWSHVVEALARVCPAVREAALAPLVPTAPLLEVVLPRLVNALVEEPDTILILDDFHRLSSASVRDSVAWFVDHVPPTVQLVLSSRTNPPLPIGALRAHGQLLELRADDLRLTAGEADEFLNRRLGLGLGADDVALLVSRTEGWPAGLYLAALSLAGSGDRHALVRSFDGTSAHIVDFLAGEVLAGFEPELQRFMLRTSVLDRMCAEVCDHVLQADASATVLESLARSNLFLVPLDDRRRWFRFHHLFAQILRVELERRDAALVPELHRRAHEWHDASGTVDEAVHHALAAGHFPAASALITRSWVLYANVGRTHSILEWLGRLPTEVLAGDRRLLLVKAWVLALTGREEEMRVAAAQVQALGGLDDGPLPDGLSSVRSSLSVLAATFAWGNVGAVVEHGTRSVSREGPESPWYPVLTWALGWAHYCNGDLDLAEKRLEETVVLGPAAEQWIVVVASIADLSLIAGMRGQHAAQARLAEEARRLAADRGLSDSVEVGEIHTARGVALAAQGRPQEALPELEHGVMLRRRWGQPLDLVDGLCALAPVAAGVGDRERARQALAEAVSVVECCADPGALPDRVAAARRAASIDVAAAAQDITDREVRVLRLMTGGRSEREIGLELFLSFNTVHTHVKSLYRKLGVSSRADALAEARDRGLL